MSFVSFLVVVIQLLGFPHQMCWLVEKVGTASAFNRLSIFSKPIASNIFLEDLNKSFQNAGYNVKKKRSYTFIFCITIINKNNNNKNALFTQESRKSSILNIIIMDKQLYNVV